MLSLVHTVTSTAKPRRCSCPVTLIAQNLLVFFLFFLPGPVRGQVGDDVDYSAFRLEDLFDVSVITASKREEPLWEAPGVISVIDAAEIETFGARNLLELLERAPATNNLFTLGINRNMIRGGDSNTAAVHVLMLINGRPLRVVNGNFSIYNPYYTFPLAMIDRIEIVRGPGSVLYGTNAFEGVINIVTKRDPGVQQISVTGGSFNAKGSEVYLNYSTGDMEIQLGAHYFDYDGWDFDADGWDLLSEVKTTVSEDVFEDDKGFYGLFNYRNFTARAFYGYNKHFTETYYNPTQTLSYHSRVSMIDLGWQQGLGENWDLEFDITHNHEDFTFWATDRTADEDDPERVRNALPLDSEDFLLEATVFGNLDDNTKVLFGSVYHHRQTNNKTGELGLGSALNEQSYSYGVYAELAWQPSRFAKFIGGFQLNKVKGLENDLVPRVGGIFNFSPRTGIKLLYGQAYRSPTELERFIDTVGVQKGNPDLKPESMATLDFQAFSKSDNHSAVFTFYRSKETDLIQLLPNEQYFLGEFGNAGELILEGWEAEFKYSPNRTWFFSASVSRQTNERRQAHAEYTGMGNEELIQDDFTRLPNLSAKLGVGFRGKTAHAGLFNNYFDAYYPLTIEPPVTSNPPSESFNMLSFNGSLDLGHFFTVDADLRLELYVTNLLDEEVWVPDLLVSTVNTIPGYGQRAYFGTFKVRF
ncbi:MAG: TonB-dependent receptor plug domain-containing protein [Acidobacteriota bacterium]|nr:TonB-dependent receptor plug domain-containing protein [Acidobacteriota bacterium]